ncbi:MAG TPA: Dyp-type peroxidase [Magnetospirillaceae bacterium]|nr:Dyp-type peroxidase [Magnetospirillaceae bacterium]
MSIPQMGIFSLGDPSHSFIEFALRGGVSAGDAVKAVSGLHDPRKTIEGVNLVAGFRPELWRAAASTDAPADAASFERALIGPDGYTIPATQEDVFIWIAGAAYDNVFDVACSIIEKIGPVATPVRELTGWTYQHNRDLTGFQDGTENPTLEDAPGIALIDDGQPGAGGSILLFQQWKHEAEAWRALAIGAQELVVGRTKPESVELDETHMPADSHVTRTTLDEDGEELKIFRRNTPYGDVADHGTVFVGFSKQQHRLQRMLERMAGIPDGVRDALTRYSTPLTGAYYFVPALSSLARFAT